MKNRFIKVFTVFLFTALIISFISYRSGFFDKKVDLKNNELIDSIVKIEAISSSKSIILIDHFKEADTTNSDNSIKEDTLIDIDPLIYSSKSLIIFKTEDLKTLRRDSIVNDSIENK